MSKTTKKKIKLAAPKGIARTRDSADMVKALFHIANAIEKQNAIFEKRDAQTEELVNQLVQFWTSYAPTLMNSIVPHFPNAQNLSTPKN